MQIQRWLDDNRDVTDWAALDDHVLDLGAEAWRHVKTDGSIGLSDDDAEAVIAILGRSSTNQAPRP